MTHARPRLVFHVGSHKTGTTAMQRRFAAMRPELQRDGLLYPDLAPFFGGGASQPTHAAVVEAAIRQDAASRERLARFADHLADQAQDGATVFLSSETAYRLAADGIDWEDETFWDARRRLLDRLASAFAAFDLSFLLCLRRPDGLAESHFAESAAATPACWPFDAFVQMKSYRYAYARQVALFRSVAPTRVLQYEAARRSGLMASACEAIGVPPVGEPERLVRQSIAVRAQCWMQSAKAEGALSARDRDRRWLFALERRDDAPFDGGPTTLWPSAARRREFVATALTGFTELPFAPVEDELPPPCHWDRADQHRADDMFRAWQTRHLPRLQTREKAGLRPFEGSRET